jgi:tRNA-modifying protein YgfZ
MSYRAVREAVALSDRSRRVRLEVAGPDRARFLHNLTTNEVKRLPVGRGCEAFVTSLQGKTLAYVSLLACADSLLVCADPGGLVLALPHFQKYGVFDEIVLQDRSESTFEFHLAGPQADELVRVAGGQVPEPVDRAHVTTLLEDWQVLVVREAPTGRPGLTLIGPRAGAPRIAGMLHERYRELGLDLPELDDETFEVLRIEAGTPVFSREVTEKNLPQEIGRDDRAICYVKGCYLGQETVARIDALGHVNQVLKGLRLEPSSPCPPPGSALEADGTRVGFITSSAVSPGWNAPIALALVRTSHARPGVELSWMNPTGSEGAIAAVCDLPMLPGA